MAPSIGATGLGGKRGGVLRAGPPPLRPWRGSTAGVDATHDPLYPFTMSTHPLAPRRVEVDLPEDAFAHHPWDPAALAREMRLLWLLEQVRQRRLGFGKAAELADVPLARFLESMAEHGITPFDYDPDEIDRELG